MIVYPKFYSDHIKDSSSSVDVYVCVRVLKFNRLKIELDIPSKF